MSDNKHDSSVTPVKALAFFKRWWLPIVVTGAIVGVVYSLAGCADPAAADAAISEWHTRTTTAMQAEGIDPASATEEDYRRIGAQVASDMLAESTAAGEGEPAAPGSDWWSVGAHVLGIAGSYFGVKGGILGAQAIAGVFAGRQTRATENIGVAISPTTSWSDTLKAIAALALDTHSPTVPAPKVHVP